MSTEPKPVRPPRSPRKPKPTSLPRERHMKPGRSTSGGAPVSMRQVGGTRHKALKAARPTEKAVPTPTFSGVAKRVNVPTAHPKGDEAPNPTFNGQAKRIKPIKSRSKDS